MKVLLLFSLCIGACLITRAVDQQTNSKDGTVAVASAKNTGARINRLIDPEFQEQLDSWAKGTETNGLLCAVSLSRVRFPAQPLPVVYINVVNFRTNLVLAMKLPREALFKIKMFDANGKAVERTSEGKEFVDWTDKQCMDWFKEQCRIRWSGRWFGVTPAPGYYAQVGVISLPELFELKEPGEYTVHVSLPVIETKQNASKKIYSETTWLPEAVAKVKILPEDVKAAAEFWNSKTNAPSK